MTAARFSYSLTTAEAVRQGPRGVFRRETQGWSSVSFSYSHRTKSRLLLRGSHHQRKTKDVQGHRWFLNSFQPADLFRFDVRRTHVHRSPGTATTQSGQSARRVRDVGPHSAPLRRERSHLRVRCHLEQRTPPFPLSSSKAFQGMICRPDGLFAGCRASPARAKF